MSGRLKFWIVVSLVGVFALGIAGGYFGERYFRHVRFERQKQERPRFPTLESMSRDLALTAEQQAKIREIFQRNEERLKSLRGLMHDHLEAMRGQLKVEIDAVLTPEQIKKMDAMVEKHRRDRKRESGQRPDDAKGE
jgi:Spy/CpxP family protein refolding chaperone